MLFSLILLLANIQWHETALLHASPIDEASKPYSCDLPAPTNLHLVLTGTTTAGLAWDPVNNAAGYQIKVYLNPNNPTLVQVTTSVNPFVTITGLTPGAAYRVTVAPMCNINLRKEFWSISENYAQIDFIALILELELSSHPLPPSASVIYPDNDASCYFPTFEWNSGEFWIKIMEKDFPNSSSIHSIFYNSHYTLGGVLAGSSLPTLSKGRTKDVPPVYLAPPCGSGDGIEDAVIGIEKGSFIGILEIDVYKSDKDMFCITPLDANYEFEVLSNMTGYSPPGGGDRNAHAKGTESAFYAVNPFTTTLDILSPSPGEEAVKVQLFHLNGQVAISQEYEKGQESYALPTASLASGLYLLRIETGNEIKTFKVIKAQH